MYASNPPSSAIPAVERNVIKLVLPGQRIVVVLIPRKLEHEQIALPDPGKVGTLEEGVVECLKVIQPAFLEHHAQSVTPVTRVVIGIDSVLHPSARRDHGTEPAQFGRRRVQHAARSPSGTARRRTGTSQNPISQALSGKHDADRSDCPDGRGRIGSGGADTSAVRRHE